MINTIKEQNKMMLSPYTLLGFVIMFIALQFVWSSYEWTDEKLSDQESYYVYYSVEPSKKSFAAGEHPSFISDVEYFKDTKIRWEDILYCRQDGRVNKYDTQYWPQDGSSTELNFVGDKSIPDDIALEDIPTWEYNQQEVHPNATECYMKWKSIGYTPSGHQKPDTGRTDWFPVNQ